MLRATIYAIRDIRASSSNVYTSSRNANGNSNNRNVSNVISSKGNGPSFASNLFIIRNNGEEANFIVVYRVVYVVFAKVVGAMNSSLL